MVSILANINNKFSGPPDGTWSELGSLSNRIFYYLNISNLNFINFHKISLVR